MLWDTNDSEGVASDGRSFSEKEVVRRSRTAKDVAGEIEVKKAVHDQVSFWEKAQREDGQEERLVVIIILVGFVISKSS